VSETDALEDPPIEQSDNTLVRLINTMIVEANSQGASDIHIEPQPGRGKLRVRFRLDGVLKPYLELPHTYRNALVARIKIMCDLDISERRRPRTARSTSPVSSLLPHRAARGHHPDQQRSGGCGAAPAGVQQGPAPIEKLGLSPHNLLALKEAINRPYGLVLCVGPTGSGKTTTLHSALSCINTPERKIWTAEDPVEITQVGLRQVQVNPKIDWTFAKALRAFLRADPDVIMVGEIRDEETASIAIESSLTGHLVMSTLHTNSAAETVTRLLDMGLDPFNFADALLAVLAQRLVRRLCPTAAAPSRPRGLDQ
jgi:type II secretory ATPase GspE/PulE/Tfp pilus assembly ATPase PilB-like protein